MSLRCLSGALRQTVLLQWGGVTGATRRQERLVGLNLPFLDISAVTAMIASGGDTLHLTIVALRFWL